MSIRGLTLAELLALVTVEVAFELLVHVAEDLDLALVIVTSGFDVDSC